MCVNGEEAGRFVFIETTLTFWYSLGMTLLRYQTLGEYCKFQREICYQPFGDIIIVIFVPLPSQLPCNQTWENYF